MLNQWIANWPFIEALNDFGRVFHSLYTYVNLCR
jgi:hypothetical protein